MKNIKGIVFDLDHTLFSRYASFEALQDVFYNTLKEYLSEKVSPRDLCTAIIDGDKKYLYKGWDHIARYVFGLGYFKKPMSENDFTKMVIGCFKEKAVPFDFTIPMLELLKKNGYKIGLITNGDSEVQRSKLKLLNLENSFDEIIVGGEFGVNKPDPSIFKEMSKRLSIPANQLIYVGDHPVFDIDGATKAGYKTIWVKSNGVWVEGCSTPTFEVDMVNEIPSILNLR
jgi:putative hydrolase of the HAD superfamily